MDQIMPILTFSIFVFFILRNVYVYNISMRWIEIVYSYRMSMLSHLDYDKERYQEIIDHVNKINE